MTKIIFLALVFCFAACEGGSGSSNDEGSSIDLTGTTEDAEHDASAQACTVSGDDEPLDLSRLSCDELSALNIRIPTVHTVQQWHDFHAENECLPPSSYEGWIAGLHYQRVCPEPFMNAERDVITRAYFDVCDQG